MYSILATETGPTLPEGLQSNLSILSDEEVGNVIRPMKMGGRVGIMPSVVVIREQKTLATLLVENGQEHLFAGRWVPWHGLLSPSP